MKSSMMVKSSFEERSKDGSGLTDFIGRTAKDMDTNAEDQINQILVSNFKPLVLIQNVSP